LASFESAAFSHALDAVAAAINKALGELLPPPGSRLADAMRYAALGQGKRLRPFLVLQSARLFDIAEAQAMRTAVALECVHCYSLVHDDLPAMDNDDLRRGIPTTHRKFDEATAILAGDALLTTAFEILADPATHESASIRTRLITAMAKASGEAGMVGGQMRDIEAETKDFASLADISMMQRGKTGALFCFAVEAGAIMADQDPTRLRQYADHLGLAFQIADDILDVESTAEVLGKATQKDMSKGKATFLDFLGMDGAKKEAARLSAAAIDALSDYASRADMLRAAAHFAINRRK
jgi:farnesyl diphosphate synthase